MRVQIQGCGPLHQRLAANREALEQQLRATTIEASNGRAWVEKIEFRTHPSLDLERIAERDDPIGLLLRELHRLASTEADLLELASEVLGDLQRKLPMELREGHETLSLESPETLRELLGEVEAELLARLSGGEAS